MAKRTRIAKLAKALGRSDGEVLAAAKSLGLPYTLPSHQVSADAEARLRQALRQRDFAPVAPQPSSRRAMAPAPTVPKVKDPLADTWMDLAMADEGAFKVAVKDKARDRSLNAPKRTPTKSDNEGWTSRDRDDDAWDRADPTPMSQSKSSKASAASLGVVPGTLLKHLGFQGKSSRKFLKPLLSPEILPLLRKSHLTPKEAKDLESAVTGAVSRSCGDRECSAALKDLDKPVMIVRDQSRCDHCHGSNAEREIRGLEQVLKDGDVSRILVIGGNTQVHLDLKRRFPDWVEFKLVGSQDRITRKDARQQMLWADVAAIWGPRLKWHKVSDPYRRQLTRAGRRALHVPHASIEQLAHHIRVHLEEGAGQKTEGSEGA